jgi:hypothetical protein
MELVIDLGPKNPQIAFADVLERCARLPEAAVVINLLILAAIQQVSESARLVRVETDGSPMKEAVFVGGYVFVVTVGAPMPDDAELCNRLIRQGKCVVWLVAAGGVKTARQLLKRLRLSRRIEVNEIGNYLGLRALFTSLDNRISVDAAIDRIVNRSRGLLKARGVGIELSVRWT